jgi:hypothetical protein
VDNGGSMLDLVAALVLLVAFHIFVLSATKRFGVSKWVAPIVVPTVFFVGLVLWVPSSPFFIPSDGSYYQAWGYSLSQSWTGQSAPLESTLWPGKGVWPLIIGVFHFFLGPVVVTLIAFNSIVLGFSVVALQKAILLLTGKNPTWSILLLVLSSAPFVMFGPSVLRESLFWLGASGGVLALCYFHRGRIPAGLFSLIAGSAVLLLFRSDAGTVIVFALMVVSVFQIGFVLGKRSRSQKTLASLALVGLLASSPLAFDGMRPGTTDGKIVAAAHKDLSGPSVLSGFNSADNLNTCDTATSGGSDLLITILCHSAVNLPQALFGPFFWEYGPEPIWLISGLSTLHFLVLLALSLVFLTNKESRGWVPIGIFLVAGLSFIMFSGLLSNYGILIRFRATTEILLLPLAVSGLMTLLPQSRAVSRT